MRGTSRIVTGVPIMLASMRGRVRHDVVAPAKQFASRLKGGAQRLRSRVVARLPEPVRRVGAEVYDDYTTHDLGGLSAELTYRLFLALFPFLILLGTLASFIANATGADNPAQSIVNSLGDALPKSTADFLKEQIDHVVGGRSAGLLTFGLIGTIWSAAGGINSIMKATNRVWGVKESRPLWKRALVMVGLTISAGIGLLLAFVVLFGAQVYGAKIADAIGAGEAFSITIAILRFPVAVVLILIAVAVLYWAAPDNDQPLGWGSIGAVFFTISWLIATSLFGLYVSHFSSYNQTYGAVGGIIVLLVWLNLTCLLLLLGSEINAVVRRERLGRASDRPQMTGQAMREGRSAR